MTKSIRPWLLLAALGVAGTTVAQAQEEMSLPTGVTQDLITQGKALFAGAGGCQMCHGPAGKGTPMTTPLTDTTWTFATGGTIDAIAEVIKNGRKASAAGKMPMPAATTKQLSADQIKALAAYVWSLSRPSS